MTVQYSLTVNQGETFTLPIQLTGSNLTGATAKMQIRTGPATPGGTILATFTSSPAVGLAFSTSSGATNPDTVTITISAATSAAWTFTSGYYDLLVTLADTTTKRLVQGSVTINQQVTV